MNYIKAQKEIFNRLSGGERVCYFPVGNEKIFVTPDGFKGWIFPIDVVAFNCNKLQEMKVIEIDNAIKPENKLEMTNDLKRARIGKNDMFCVRLKAPGKNVFVNMKYLEAFQNPAFYQEREEKLKRIVVTERNHKNEETPVAIVLPVRSDTWGDDYYKED